MNRWERGNRVLFYASVVDVHGIVGRVAEHDTTLLHAHGLAAADAWFAGHLRAETTVPLPGLGVDVRGEWRNSPFGVALALWHAEGFHIATQVLLTGSNSLGDRSKMVGLAAEMRERLAGLGYSLDVSPQPMLELLTMRPLSLVVPWPEYLEVPARESGLKVDGLGKSKEAMELADTYLKSALPMYERRARVLGRAAGLANYVAGAHFLDVAGDVRRAK